MVGHGDEGRLVAGRYRLLERIGRGGMGTVWRAEDELLGRQVAVKKLHPPQPHMDDEELATLFERTRREARAAARISHPNVVVVHDVVDDEGLPSIVMEYVPSETLGERLKAKGPLPPAEAARIGRGMIAALRAAHRAGVLHRDVKPGNVLLGEGGEGGEAGPRVVLTDFGIAQASGTSTLTRTGELIGSIDFLSPERIRGALPGPEADLWALGATLYQAVEGVSPFRRPTAIETAYAIAEDPVRPPEHAGALADVIAGLLAKEPAERLSAEDAERMLRIPAAEADTALVDRGRFESPPQGDTTAHLGTHRQLPYGQPAPAGSTARTTAYGSAHSGGGPYAPATGPVHIGPPGPPGPSGPQPPAARPRRRVAPWLAGIAVLVLLAAGGALAARHFRGDNEASDGGGSGGPTGSPSAPTTAPTAPTRTPPPSSPPPVPDGYTLAGQPDHGYALPVPDGWTKSVKNGGDEVDWVAPDGLAGLRVNALDFASTDPLQHFEQLEPQTREQVGDTYHRQRMERTTAFGDPAALWEFTFTGTARDWHAIDLGFGKPGQREFAIYLSAPQDDWQQELPVFNTAVAGFRQTG
jgi:serine/threonine protein kinase